MNLNLHCFFGFEPLNFPGCMFFEEIVKLHLDPIIMVQWKMAGICKVTKYVWRYTHLSGKKHDYGRFRVLQKVVGKCW